MKPGTTYINCPDNSCYIWDSEKSCMYSCPYKEDMTKTVICWNCNEKIVMPLTRSMMRRLEHTCKDGSNPFILETGKVITKRK